MNNSSNFVKDCFDCAKVVESISNDLNRLSFFLSETGNLVLSDKLQDYSSKLMAESEKIRKICGDKTEKDLKEIQQATGNMIRAALKIG